LGFGAVAKANRKKEELEEWKRLLYVDFTRASSILVLPRYELKKEYEFLGKALSGDFIKRCEEIPTNTSWLRRQGTLLARRKKNGGNEKSDVEIILSHDKESAKSADDLANQTIDQQNQMSSLQSALPGKAILQYSYSSLASRVAKPGAGSRAEEDEIETVDQNRSDKEGATPTSSDDSKSKQKEIDPEVISNVVEGSANSEPEQLSLAEEKYPRGAKIGNVLHNTLEKSEFENFVSADDSLDGLLNNVPAKLKNIIKEEFNAESLPLAAHEDEWMEITLRYLYNTLHATLPVIAGGQFVESAKPFRLVDLPENAHKPEVQFGLNADGKGVDSEALATLHRVCKGFIDLLFVRKDENGNMRYSILDWKSDFLEEYSPESVKEKVDEEYSVQRVLYSYCLIQWLKNFGFCKGMSEQDIFANHFGGIYYAFLRGTDGKTSKGIYAQTWKDYATLEKAYMEVKKLMTQGAN
jgi:exodeoxyribonuclease V beta subunit